MYKGFIFENLWPMQLQCTKFYCQKIINNIIQKYPSIEKISDTLSKYHCDPDGTFFFSKIKTKIKINFPLKNIEGIILVQMHTYLYI